MNFRDVSIVFRKELTDTLRDYKTLLLMLLLPILSYPLTTVLVHKYVEKRERTQSAAITRVIALGDVKPLLPFFAEDKRTRLVTTKTSPDSDVLNGSADLVLSVPDDFSAALNDRKRLPELTLRDSALRDNLTDEANVQNVLDHIRDSLAVERLSALGAPRELLNVLSFSQTTTSTGQERSGSMIGMLLPAVITLTLLLASMYPALDLVTGERERGTLQLLLMLPVKRSDIILGKLATVSLVGLVALCLNVVSMAATMHFCMPTAYDVHGAFTFTVPVSRLLLAVLVTLPLIILIASVSMLISAYARTFQQGQSLFVPGLLVIILLAMASLSPSLPFVIFFVPVANVAQCIKLVLQGTGTPLSFLATTITSWIYAAGLAWLASRLLDREDILFGLVQNPTKRTSYTKEVLVLFSSGILIIFYGGQLGQSWDKLSGMIAIQLSLVAVSLATIRFLRLPQAATLSLRTVPLPTLLAAFLIAPSTLIVGNFLVALQSLVLPVPVEYSKAIAEYIIPSGKPVWAILLVVAVMPGICEEVLLRGAILGLLRRRMRGLLLCIVVGVLFGIMHVSTFRFLPTAVLGIVLSLITVATGSIFPAMALHATHNALAVLLAVNHINDISPPAAAASLLSGAVGLIFILRSIKRPATF